MRQFILIFIAIFFTTVFFENCILTRKITSEKISPFKENLLAAYGEKIYRRESCDNCHTQQIEEESLQLISLDGIGGKYPSSWLYHYLLDPPTLIPESRMPSYSNLYRSPFNEEVLSRINKENKLNKSGDKLWSNLITQAQSLSDELNSQGITTTNNTEALALISYIQQIHASKKKLELDSLENVEYLNKQKKWNNVTLDSIIEIANDEANIDIGKLLFKANCSPCHGQEGEGGIGPNLTDDYWLHGGKKLDIARTIIYGVPEKGMISWRSQLTPKEVGELISYISSSRVTNPKNAKAPQGKKE